MLVPPKKIGVLISGRGSNLAAILNAQSSGRLQSGNVAVVISNKAKAKGLEIATAAGIPALNVPMKTETGEKKPLETFDREVLTLLKQHDVDVIVLAGYGRILSDVLLEAFPGRIVNIHPSLLPKFGGEGMLGDAVHQAVLDAGEKETGCSVHLVTETVDGGPILGQSRVSVLPADTVETLAARVLEQEHQLYPAVLETWLSKETVADPADTIPV